MTVANYKTRVSLLAISLVFALTAFAPIIASAENNGTLKVHEFGTVSGSEGNDPKVCKFNFEGFKFDEEQSGKIYVEPQGGNPGTTDTAWIDFGPTNSNGYYETEYINMGGITLDDGHYKSTLYGKDQNGNYTIDLKAKSKVFKVECEKPLAKYNLQFEKKWVGDQFNAANVYVEINVDELVWNSTDKKPVPVKKGKTYQLSEKVTGLPENCTYTSDLPKEYTPFPKPIEVENGTYSLDAVNIREPKIVTLPVTNTVTCEDEGEVLGTTTATTTPTTTVASLPNTGSKVAAIAAILTAITTGAALFSTTLRSALVKFTN